MISTLTILSATTIMKTVDHLFMNNDFVKRFGIQFSITVPFLLKVISISLTGLIKSENTRKYITDYLGCFWKKKFVITWSSWIHWNNIIFRNRSIQLAHIINLIVSNMRYYNVVSTTIEQIATLMFSGSQRRRIVERSVGVSLKKIG